MTGEASGERDVLVYMTSWCGDCRRTLRWLDAAGVAYRRSTSTGTRRPRGRSWI